MAAPEATLDDVGGTEAHADYARAARRNRGVRIVKGVAVVPRADRCSR